MANEFKLHFEGDDDRRSGRGYAKLPGRNDDPSENGLPLADIIGPTDLSKSGIQLDQIGMAEQWYEGIRGIREYVNQMKSMGITVTKGYDFRNPQAAKAHSLFQQAIAHQYKLTERLNQGARNLSMMQDLETKGQQIISDPSILEGGPITAADVHRGTFSTELEDIKTYNDYLSKVPTSKAEYDAMVEFRNNALREIEGRAAASGKPPEYLEFLRSHLANPREYDPTQDNLAKAKTSEAFQRAKSYKVSRAAADARWGSIVDFFTDWEDAGRKGNVPKVGIGPSLRGMPPKSPFMSDVFSDKATLSGNTFNGQGQFVLDEIRATPDGKMEAVYKAIPGVQITDTERSEALMTMQKVVGTRTVKEKDGELIVNFTETNVTPLIASMMSEAAFAKQMESAQENGILQNGRITLKGMKRVYGRNPDKEPEGVSLFGGGN